MELKSFYKLSLDNQETGFVKFAQASSEVNDFVEHLTKKPNCSYVIIAAVGADEYFGPNSRGDAFPEAELKRHHKSFENGYVFIQHFNKDPKAAIGKILFSSYSDKMHRVELVCEIWGDKCPADILEKLDKGETLETSMGCKVKADVCSICKNVAHTAAEHCEHLRDHAGAYLPDGRRISAINVEPRFFDISIVRRGADRTSKVLTKVAECKHCKNCGNCGVFPAMDVIQEWESRLEKEAKLQKKSDIFKDTPTTFGKAIHRKIESMPGYDKKVEDAIGRIKPAIEKITPTLNDGEIKKLAQYPLDKVLSTLNCSFVNLSPQEFQKLVLTKLGFEDQAKNFERLKITFNYIPKDEVSDNLLHVQKADIKIANEIKDIIEKRSSFPPMLINRIEKYGSAVQNDFHLWKIAQDPVLEKVEQAYGHYRAMPPEARTPLVFYALLGGLLGFAISRSGIFSPGVEGYSFDGSEMTPERYQAYLRKQSDEIEKDAAWVKPLLYVGAPLGWYMGSEWQKMRAAEGIPLSKPARWTMRHPLAGTLGTYGVMLASGLKKSPLLKHGTIRESLEQHQDTVEKLLWEDDTNLAELPFVLAGRKLSDIEKLQKK